MARRFVHWLYLIKRGGAGAIAADPAARNNADWAS